MRYVRQPEFDRRIQRGDDWSGDAWLDIEAGLTFWVAPGILPSESEGGANQPPTVSGDRLREEEKNIHIHIHIHTH